MSKEVTTDPFIPYANRNAGVFTGKKYPPGGLRQGYGAPTDSLPLRSFSEGGRR